MGRLNVLVFPCGSEIALEIYRAVNYSTYFHLIGGSSVDDHGKFVFEDYVDGIPFADDQDFIPTIQKIVKEKNIDIIYPAMDSVITILKNAENKLKCKVVASPAKTTNICLSKRKTYSLLNDVIKVPKEYKDTLEVETFPVFCKPEIGYGARGAKKVDDLCELQQFISKHPDFMILEYLPGEEYTVDCFTDRHHDLLYCHPRRRARISNGISVNTYPVDSTEEFIRLAKDISKRVEFRGAWFFQVKRDSNGELTLLEVASRFGGSSSLFRGRGVNFPLLSLFDILNKDVSVLENQYYIEMDRALDNKYKIDISYNKVYIDFDDTIILDEKYFNVDAMKFIYQCKNKGKQIILLSSHEGDLNERLGYFGITDLFNKVIHIDKNDRKADYIDKTGSIFIDDSFSERADVLEQIGIPVFSVDMIPCLFD